MRGRNWESTWRNTVGPQVAEIAVAGQEAAAAESEAYVAAVLAELGLQADASDALDLTAFSGAAGDGRTIESLLYGAVVVAAKTQYQPDVAALSATQIQDAALDAAASWLEEQLDTILADAARAAETVSIAQRPWVAGWVRMVEPGACSRCVLLAGKFYLYNEGFLRHPRCRCKHIPAAENLTKDLRTDPNAYFDSLSTAEQDRIFTVAGAEAVRLGADITQVVNARRGMATAQQNPRGWIPKGRLVPTDVYGRPAYITDEGVTKRGTARRSMGKGRPVRLMPESILEFARDRDDAIRLLRLYGYFA